MTAGDCASRATAGGQPLKQRFDVGAFEKACLRRSDALDGNPHHLLGDGQPLGDTPSEVLEEADEHGAPMIPRPHVIVPLVLETVQEALHAVDGEVVETQS